MEALNILGVVSISSCCVEFLWLALPMTWRLKLLSTPVAASFISTELKILPEWTSNVAEGPLEGTALILADGFYS